MNVFWRWKRSWRRRSTKESTTSRSRGMRTRTLIIGRWRSLILRGTTEAWSKLAPSLLYSLHTEVSIITPCDFALFSWLQLELDDVSTEKYLQEAWPIVKGALKEFGIACELNLVTPFLFSPWVELYLSDVRMLTMAVIRLRVQWLSLQLERLEILILLSKRGILLGFYQEVFLHLRLALAYVHWYIWTTILALYIFMVQFYAVYVGFHIFGLVLQAIKILNDEMQCDIIKIGNLVRNKVCDVLNNSLIVMHIIIVIIKI